eukprot:Hpha_TRINITY_DN31260_c0_g1::TRINITY_DN31260_c0_g1_i1::g.2365::m.2365
MVVLAVVLLPLTYAANARSACLNPVVNNNRYVLSEGVNSTELADWPLRQVIDMQRHTARYLYAHPEPIKNRCWAAQLNSSLWAMGVQCEYNRSSVWEDFAHEQDPYAVPLFGHCSPKQATTRGLAYAETLGRLFQDELGELLVGGGGEGAGQQSCPAGSVSIAVDAVQKNERTGQGVYTGMCGRAPQVAEFPPETTLVRAEKRKGAPFYLNSGLCTSTGVLQRLNREATEAKMNSSWWNGAVKGLSDALASIMDLPPVPLAQRADLLDNAIDCSVVHDCSGLEDVPAAFLSHDSGNFGSDFFSTVDGNETLSRLFAFDYFKSKGAGEFETYASLDYGYYFATVLDKMALVVEGRGTEAPRVALQVMSDSHITPQLKMLGLDHAARHRPPYLSTLLFELRQRRSPDSGLAGSETGEFGVRTVFNGEVQLPCGDASGQLCSWAQFSDALLRLIPARAACPDFWDWWEPKSHFIQTRFPVSPPQ